MRRQKNSGEAHRLRPHDREAELAIVGAFFLNPDVVGNICLQKGLTFLHLHQPAVSTVFAIISALWRDGKACDFVTVTARLRDGGELENVGGAAFVTELATRMPTAANAGDYADLILEKYKRRELLRLCEESEVRAQDGMVPVSEVVREIAGRVEVIEKAGSGGSLAELLDARRFDAAKPPPKPEPVFTLAGHIIATPGNLLAVQAKSKVGKTGALSGFFASTMAEDGDFLGFKSGNPDGLALIHFDTEQSPWDHHEVILRALRRANLEAAPGWLRSYCITDHPLQVRRSLVRQEMERARRAHGSVLAVVIDGIGDLCADPNDQEEAIGLVGELHQLAIQFETVIACVLHENPGTEIAKTRGHLGSHLERKAETNLRLEKDAAGVTVIFCEKGRHCHIPKEWGHRFAWSKEHEMHVTTEAKFNADAKAKGASDGRFAETGDHDAELLEMLEAQAGQRMGDLVERMKEEHDVSRATTYRAQKELIKKKKAELRKGKLYRL